MDHNGAAPSPAAPAPAAAAGPRFGVDNLVLTILCVVLFVLTATQAVQCWKRRRRNRAERELERVSTHPASRMLVLR